MQSSHTSIKHKTSFYIIIELSQKDQILRDSKRKYFFIIKFPDQFTETEHKQLKIYCCGGLLFCQRYLF